MTRSGVVFAKDWMVNDRSCHNDKVSIPNRKAQSIHHQLAQRTILKRPETRPTKCCTKLILLFVAFPQ